jgi:hypothetical protein
VKTLGLVFFPITHLNRLFCVQPWDEFRIFECYLHPTYNKNMFGDGSGSLHFYKNKLSPKVTSQLFGHRCKVTQSYQNYSPRYDSSVWYRVKKLHNKSLTCFDSPKDLFDNGAQFNVRLHNLRS